MDCDVCDKSFETTRATMCHIAAVHPTWLAERLARDEPDVETDSKVKVEVEAPEKKGFFDRLWDGPWTIFDLFEDEDREHDKDEEPSGPGMFSPLIQGTGDDV